MATKKEGKVRRPETICIMCGSENWCDCEWDTFTPSQFVSTPYTYRPKLDEDILEGQEEIGIEAEKEEDI